MTAEEEEAMLMKAIKLSLAEANQDLIYTSGPQKFQRLEREKIDNHSNIPINEATQLCCNKICFIFAFF